MSAFGVRKIMNALEPVFRPFVGLLNNQIRRSSAALGIAERISGQRVAIRVRNTAIAVNLLVAPDGVTLAGDEADRADVIIEGSLLALASLAGSDPLAGIRSGKVELSGDTDTAEAFQELLRLARPELEDSLAQVLGDGPAHAIGQTLSKVADLGRERAREIGETVTENFKRRNDLPVNDEFAKFSAEVRDLRDRAQRALARAGLLRRSNTN